MNYLYMPPKTNDWSRSTDKKLQFVITQLRNWDIVATFRLVTAGLLQAMRSTDYKALFIHEGRLRLVHFEPPIAPFFRRVAVPCAVRFCTVFLLLCFFMVAILHYCIYNGKQQQRTFSLTVFILGSVHFSPALDNPLRPSLDLFISRVWIVLYWNLSFWLDFLCYIFLVFILQYTNVKCMVLIHSAIVYRRRTLVVASACQVRS